MPNLNYAETWQPELLDILIQETITSPFITSNVRWLDAKTFHFTQMSVSGFKNHKRNGGWNKGEFNQTDVPFTVEHDRDVQFLVDRADVDETNATASIQNISRVFEQTQVAPETDAVFFSKVAAVAQATTKYHSETAASEYTAENVLPKLKAMLATKIDVSEEVGILMAAFDLDGHMSSISVDVAEDGWWPKGKKHVDGLENNDYTFFFTVEFGTMDYPEEVTHDEESI